MRGAIPPLPNTPPWRSTELKHRDNFTFNFTFNSKYTDPVSRQVVRQGSDLKCNIKIETDLIEKMSSSVMHMTCIREVPTPSVREFYWFHSTTRGE